MLEDQDPRTNILYRRILDIRCGPSSKPILNKYLVQHNDVPLKHLIKPKKGEKEEPGKKTKKKKKTNKKNKNIKYKITIFNGRTQKLVLPVHRLRRGKWWTEQGRRSRPRLGAVQDQRLEADCEGAGPKKAND